MASFLVARAAMKTLVKENRWVWTGGYIAEPVMGETRGLRAAGAKPKRRPIHAWF